jgi:hypothetical protein
VEPVCERSQRPEQSRRATLTTAGRSARTSSDEEYLREAIERKGGATAVDGPVLEPEGLRVHQEFY